MKLDAQFQDINRSLQFRAARDLCLGLSLLCVCALIFIAPGGIGLANPKNWLNYFRVMAADGYFIEYTVVLLVATLVFCLLAVVFEFLRRRLKSL
jgi:hypothetical protein